MKHNIKKEQATIRSEMTSPTVVSCSGYAGNPNNEDSLFSDEVLKTKANSFVIGDCMKNNLTNVLN